MDQQFNFQEELINQIKFRFKGSRNWVHVLNEILSLSPEVIYSRQRGDTQLNIDEVQAIAQNFDISIDKLLHGKQDIILFSYNQYDREITSFKDYLDQIYSQVTTLNQLQGLKVYYSSREIPFFIFMMFPKLLAFKLYLFGLTEWEFEYLQNRKFSFDIVGKNELEQAKNITSKYCLVDSINLWPISVLEQTLNQIVYMAQIGNFQDKEIPISICGEVRECINHSLIMAQKGKKFLPGEDSNNQGGSFNLFFNEIASPDNIILIVAENQRALFNTFTSPNYIFSYDQGICHYMEKWFENILSHSTSLSVYDRKSRNHYFNKLNDKIDTTLKRIDQIFEFL